jgi:hypothetical protein
MQSAETVACSNLTFPKRDNQQQGESFSNARNPLWRHLQRMTRDQEFYRPEEEQCQQPQGNNESESEIISDDADVENIMSQQSKWNELQTQKHREDANRKGRLPRFQFEGGLGRIE